MREHQKRLLVTVSGIEPLSPPSKGVSLPLIYTEITGTRVWNRTRTFRLSGEYTDHYITRAKKNVLRSGVLLPALLMPALLPSEVIHLAHRGGIEPLLRSLKGY